jgi:hypothetical protein
MDDRACILAVVRARRVADDNPDVLKVCQLLEDRVKGDIPDQLVKRRKSDNERQRRRRNRLKASCHVTTAN